jgi:HKD family nuclease
LQLPKFSGQDVSGQAIQASIEVKKKLITGRTEIKSRLKKIKKICKTFNISVNFSFIM